MRRWLLRHPFLALGLATLLLFFAVETLRSHGAVLASQRLAVPLRVLIIPMYLVWLGFTILHVAIAGPSGIQNSFLRWALYVLQLAGGLAPYALADYLLRRWRDASTRHHLAA